MSLLICSSGQEKYTTTGFQTLDNDSVLTSTSQAAGLQNPASFTNNINPVVKIPANAEVALKSASYFKNDMFQIGSNTSFAFYFGEYLRSRWGLEPNLSLDDTTNFPIPMPIPKGTYNMRTFANELSAAFDKYISHPDLRRYCWVETADSQGDGVNKVGLLFNFQQGNQETPYDIVAGGDLVLDSTMSPWRTTTNEFAWTKANLRYTGSATADADNNYGILETAPLTQKGGSMIWNVTNSASDGFRIGLTRPTARDGREEPPNFSSGGDIDVFFDYVLDYDGETFKIYHAVIGEDKETLVMKEVRYYDNLSANFYPQLDTYETTDHQPMFHTTPWTNTDAESTPVSVAFLVSGEDITIQYVDDSGAIYMLTDTRLCTEQNNNIIAFSPERNVFPKPTGLTTHALYPKVNTKQKSGYLVLSKYDAPVYFPSETIFEKGQSSQGLVYTYPQIADPTIAGGRRSAGDSFYGRSVLEGQMKTGQIALMVDRAKPYQSSLKGADPQKAYVGLAGPTGASPPVRESEGDPYIPATAVDDANSIAYGKSIILVPSTSGIGANKVKGTYCSESSDVSSLLGFPDKSVVESNRSIGNNYLLANELNPDSVDPPTDTEGAFFGFYVGSEAAPTFSRGQMFLRIPQFTHQSQNFGKGIPSKIISSLPPATDSGTAGEIFYEPSNMTYVSLNNPAELNINILTLEIVDKQDQLIEGLSKSSTFVLHVRQKSKM